MLKQVQTILYATPSSAEAGRSAYRMLLDAIIGTLMVVTGLLFAIVALVIDRRDSLHPFWDRILDLVPNGLFKIFRGRYGPEKQ